MNANSKLLFLIFIFIVSAVLFPCLASAKTAIPGAPYTINVPGAYYLTQNINTSAATVITINASNVTLDLDTHTITSTYSGSGGVVIFCNSCSNVRVTNGKITGNANGIYLVGSTDPRFQIDHVTLTNQTNYGIYVASWGSTPGHAVIEDNEIISANVSQALVVSFMSGGRVERNTIRGGTYLGLQLYNSTDMLVANNVVSSCPFRAIELRDASHRNKLYNNVANSATTGFGIYIVGDNNTIDWNTVSNNSTGINISGTGNIYSNNRAKGNISSGIVAPGQIDAGGNFQ